MASRRNDPKVAYEVFKSNISDIKERATVDLSKLADELRKESIITEKDKAEATDSYTGKPEADRRGKLIDKVQENLKAGVGEAFGIFLGILRAEKMPKFNILAKELEEKYDTEIAGVPEATSSQPPSSSSPPTQDSLDIDDKEDVIEALEKHKFAATSWRKLCGKLGVSHHNLGIIETQYKEVERQLEEGICYWLEEKINLEKFKKPSWSVLIEALKKMNENAVVAGIQKEKKI